MSRRFAFALVFLATALSALYLRSAGSAPQIEQPIISSVLLVASGEGRALQIKGWHAQDCAALLQVRSHAFPDNLDILLYRELPARAVCGLQQVPFTIAASIAQPWQYIVINEQAWARGAPGDSYHELRTYPVQVESATIAPSEDMSRMMLHMRGQHSSGCDLPLLFSLRTGQGSAALRAVNASPAEQICPDMLLDFEHSTALPATSLADSAYWTVNDYLISVQEQNSVSQSDKVLTNIHQVQAQLPPGVPRRIFLQIEGEHPDGCDLPVYSAQQREGTAIAVEIYRQVPLDMFCPMILQPYSGRIALEGEFATGTYHITVNGSQLEVVLE